MQPVALISIPGFTKRMLGANAPHLSAFAQRGFVTPLSGVTPGVTCAVQASVLTGTLPAQHGIVANGWFFRDLNDVMLWRQSEKLITGETIWQAGKRRDPAFTCLKHFWWYNMASTADYYVTPRPAYPADGLKLPDIYAQPAGLAQELQREFGEFPLFNFWGPTANIISTRWIAKTGMHLHKKYQPTLSLIYLPHLDYHQQRVGPAHPSIAQEIRDLDAVCGELIAYFQQAGVRVLFMSEYDIQPVTTPVDINRILRENGFLRVIHNATGELIDFGASAAFAVADHQIAHVYVQRQDVLAEVTQLLRATPGIETVHDAAGKASIGLDHPRAGDLVALAAPQHWFTYYYWLDSRLAPDFARTVDIHRKPGYDPCELLVDPKLLFPTLKIAWTLMKKQFGFRYLMDVIPLDATLARGSHGRPAAAPEDLPVLLGDALATNPPPQFTGIKNFVLDLTFQK